MTEIFKTISKLPYNIYNMSRILTEFDNKQLQDSQLTVPNTFVNLHHTLFAHFITINVKVMGNKCRI